MANIKGICNKDDINILARACVRVRACVRLRECLRVHVRAPACVRARACVCVCAVSYTHLTLPTSSTV